MHSERQQPSRCCASGKLTLSMVPSEDARKRS